MTIYHYIICPNILTYHSILQIWIYKFTITIYYEEKILGSIDKISIIEFARKNWKYYVAWGRIAWNFKNIC